MKIEDFSADEKAKIEAAVAAYNAVKEKDGYGYGIADILNDKGYEEIADKLRESSDDDIIKLFE